MKPYVLLAALLAFPAAAENITGPAQVRDGASIFVQGREIRLFGIDAPEWNQSCTLDGRKWMAGREATAWLKSLIEGKTVSCNRILTDRYRRAVAMCFLETKDIGGAMVGHGWARAYCEDPPECKRFTWHYGKDEFEAKKAVTGIWKGTCDAPWDWRKSGRN